MTHGRVVHPVGAAHHRLPGVVRGAGTLARAARARPVKRRAALLVRGTLHVLTRILTVEVKNENVYRRDLSPLYLDTLTIFH